MIDDRLSYRALGLLTRLRATLQPGDRIDTRTLVRPEHRGEGRDAIRTALRELATAGYVAVTTDPAPGGRWTKTTRLINPAAKPQVAPKTDFQGSENTNPQVSPRTGNQGSDTTPPTPENQGSDTFPQVAPRTDFQGISTTGSSTREKTNYEKRSSSAHTSAPAHTRPRGTVTAAELNENAVQPTAYRLISTWNDTLSVKLRPAVQRALAKVTDALLRDGADLTILRAALDDWATRGRTPDFLRYCYDDAARTARAAAAHAGPETPARATPKLSKRTRKALEYLAPDDPLRAEYGLPMAPSHESLTSGFEPRVIEGGRSA